MGRPHRKDQQRIENCQIEQKEEKTKDKESKTKDKECDATDIFLSALLLSIVTKPTTLLTLSIMYSFPALLITRSIGSYAIRKKKLRLVFLFVIRGLFLVQFWVAVSTISLFRSGAVPVVDDALLNSEPEGSNLFADELRQANDFPAVPVVDDALLTLELDECSQADDFTAELAP